MATDRVAYRKLRDWKYSIATPFETTVKISPPSIIRADLDYIALHPDGTLCLKKGYAWNGASGPAIDTTSWMRASLVHDALYQLIRTGRLAPHYRAYADTLMRQMCLADGMFWPRAWYSYLFVAALGGFFIRPEKDRPVLHAP
jgi:hypothetical protein